MTFAATVLLLAVAALRTRLARGCLAYLLLKTSNVLYDAGARAMTNLEEDFHG
ncbi:hypothetical protein [Mesorhizobium sp. NZP2234]|uniref:hypothetical protein n=1 Tax=Mesorhizobium sp. NZP2234 TaxID=2483402 RepID=UPI0015581747|nr:hypothetical protein [Mesorhizobium sp. NZP2234]